MKKIYLTLSLAAMATVTFAQQQGNVVKPVLRGTIEKSNAPTMRAPTDTLGIGITTEALNALPIFANSGMIYNFGYTGGGYVYGVNVSTNNLNEIAQGYFYSGPPALVEGVIMLGIGKTAGAAHTSAAAFNVRHYGWSATGGIDYSTGSPVPAPGPTTTLETVSYLFDDFDTTFLAYNVATFSTPSMVTSDFAVGAEYASLKNTFQDTIGFACDAPGDAASLNYAFHKIGTSWYISNTIFGTPGTLDNNIAIFPMINTAVGTEELPVINGMSFSNFPNPCVNNTTVTYSLNNNTSKAELFVMEMNGKVVANYEMGAKVAGTHTVNVNTTALSSGTYLFLLKSDAGAFAQKFTVAK